MSKPGELGCLLAVGIGLCIPIADCSGRVSYDDDYHHNYHHWNNHEVIVYRSYYETDHRPYREYNNLSKEEQREYSSWRHDHHGVSPDETFLFLMYRRAVGVASHGASLFSEAVS